jgi:hypothetical protein
LATQKQVTVQFVYVIEEKSICKYSEVFQSIDQSSRQTLKKSGASNSATSVLTKSKTQKLEVSSLKTSKKPYPVPATAIQHETLEQAGSHFKAGSVSS